MASLIYICILILLVHVATIQGLGKKNFQINDYNKILYHDTSTVINNNITNLFEYDVSLVFYDADMIALVKDVTLISMVMLSFLKIAIASLVV